MARFHFEALNLWLTSFIVIGVVSFDLLTKMLIVDLVMQPPRTIPVTSFLDLTVRFNTGVFFGLFSDLFAERPIPLIVTSIVIICLLLLWAAAAKSAFEVVALGLVCGGAIANLWGRIQRGDVMDFIEVHLGEGYWLTFNLADVAIAGGAAGVLIGSFFNGSNKRNVGDGTHRDKHDGTA